jgi:hypothetical protein
MAARILFPCIASFHRASVLLPIVVPKLERTWLCFWLLMRFRVSDVVSPYFVAWVLVHESVLSVSGGALAYKKTN